MGFAVRVEVHEEDCSARCDLFITNDERLSRKIVPGIQFIASLDHAPV